MAEKKPYSEYTCDEKLVCVKHVAEQGYKADLMSDPNENIRLEAYRALGRTEEAKQDNSWLVRLEAYRVLGRDEQAKQDPSAAIRFEAYSALGRDQSAAHDADDLVCRAAQLYYNTVGKRADE